MTEPSAFDDGAMAPISVGVEAYSRRKRTVSCTTEDKTHLDSWSGKPHHVQGDAVFGENAAGCFSGWHHRRERPFFHLRFGYVS